MYRITDGAATSGDIAVTIDVENLEPTAAPDHYYVKSNELLTVAAFNGVLASDVDPDGDRMTAAVARAPSHGLVLLAADGSFTYRPDVNFAGSDWFSYVASDGIGHTFPAEVRIDVVAELPPGVADGYAAAHGRHMVVSAAEGVLSNDTPPGYLGPLTVQLVALPMYGQVSLAADGAFSYVPTGDFVGTDQFAYVLSNGVEVSAPVPVTLTLTNTAPGASDDSYSVAEDAVSQSFASVLENDADPDGDVLSAYLVGAPRFGTLVLSLDGTFVYTPAVGFHGEDAFTYRATDNQGAESFAVVTLNVDHVNHTPIVQAASRNLHLRGLTTFGGESLLNAATDVDGNALTALLVAPPVHGEVVLSSDGTFTYTPNAGAAATGDSFTFRVSDGMTYSEPAPVTLTFTNAVPTAEAAQFSVLSNGILTVPQFSGLAVRSRDPDGDPLTVHLVTGPANGTLALNPDGSFSYIPAAGHLGPDTFTYFVRDGSTQSDPVTVTVNATASGIAANGDMYRLRHGQSLAAGPSRSVLLNDTRPDGATLTAQLVSGPAQGTMSLQNDGSFSFVPLAGFVGFTSFTYRIVTTINGQQVTSEPAKATIEVVEHAPRGNADHYATVAGGTVEGFVLANDYDEDAEPLTATVVASPAHASPFGGFTFDPSGHFSYLPAPNFAGQDQFTYRVSDGCEHVDVVVTIDVRNAVPVASNRNYRTRHDTPVTGNLSLPAYDPDGNPKFLHIATMPAHGTVTFNANSGAFTYTPNPHYVGGDSFGYRLFDADTGLPTAAYPEFTVAVDVWNHVPFTTPDSILVRHGGTATVNLLANDKEWDGDAIQAAIAQPPMHGSLSITPEGIATYTADANYAGGDSFTYTVSDGAQSTSPVLVSVTVYNSRPIALNDTFNTTHSTPVTGNLISGAAGGASDFDPDTEDVSGLKIVDGDLSAPGINPDIGPRYGTVTIASDGQFTYTPYGASGADNPQSPGAVFAGVDSFRYQLGDGAAIAFGWVTINVRNFVPQAVDDMFELVLPEAGQSPATWDLAANDILGDDGDSLTGGTLSDPKHKITYELADITPGTGTDIPIVVGGKGQGTVTFTSEGKLTFKPSATFTGPLEMAYRVKDPAGLMTFTQGIVTIVHQPKYVQSTDDYFEVAHNVVNASVNVVLNDYAGDGAGKTVLAIDGVRLPWLTAEGDPIPGAPQTITLSPSASSSLKGTLMVKKSGDVSYSAPVGFSGEDSFSYTLVGDRATRPAKVRIHVLGPAYQKDKNVVSLNAKENQPATYSTASWPGGFIATLPLSNIIMISQPKHGTASFVPQSGGANQFAYNPHPGYVGPDSFSYMVKDTLGRIATPTVVNLTVHPHGTHNVTALGKEDTTTSIDVLAAVLGSISTTGYNLNLPSSSSTNWTASANGGTVSFVPKANHYTRDGQAPEQVPFTITGPDSALVTGTLSVHVAAVNDAPAVIMEGYQTTVDGPTTFVVSDGGSDADTGYLACRFVDIKSGPAKGTLRWTSGGALAYTPFPHVSGDDSFTYIAYDQDWTPAEEKTFTFNIASTTTTPGTPPPNAPASLTMQAAGSYSLNNCTISFSSDNNAQVQAQVTDVGVTITAPSGGGTYRLQVEGYGTPPEPVNVTWAGGFSDLAINTTGSIAGVSGSGVLSLVAGRNITGDVSGSSVFVSATAISGTVTATAGTATVNARGSVGAVTASGNAFLHVRGNLQSVKSTNGDLSVYVEGDIAGEVTAGGKIATLTARDINGNVQAVGDIGFFSDRPSGFVARDVKGTVTSQSRIYIVSGRDISGTITAPTIDEVKADRDLTSTIQTAASGTSTGNIGYVKVGRDLKGSLKGGRLTSLEVGRAIKDSTVQMSSGYVGCIDAGSSWVTPETASGSIQNTTISAQTYIGRLQTVAGVGHAGSVTGTTITTATGDINYISVAGAFDATISCAGNLPTLRAGITNGGNLTGSIGANRIGVVEARRGNVEAVIASNTSVQAVIAGGNISKSITAKTGRIGVDYCYYANQPDGIVAGIAGGGDISAAISAGTDISYIRAYNTAPVAWAGISAYNPLQADDAGAMAKLIQAYAATKMWDFQIAKPELDALPNVGAKGDITGQISVGGSLWSLRADRKLLSSSVTAGTIGGIYTGGDVNSTITSKDGGVSLIAWGPNGVSGAVNAKGDVEVSAYGDLSSAITSTGGRATLTSWGKLKPSKVDAAKGMGQWGRDAVKNNAIGATSGAVTTFSWGDAEQAFTGKVGAVASFVLGNTTLGTVITPALSLYSGLNATLMWIAGVDPETLACPFALIASKQNVDLNGMNTSQNMGAGYRDKVVRVIAGGNVGGTVKFDPNTTASITALGTVNVTIEATQQGLPPNLVPNYIGKGVAVEAAHIFGTYLAHSVSLDASGSTDAAASADPAKLPTAIKATVKAQTFARVTAHGAVDGKIVVQQGSSPRGVAEIVASGDVKATIEAAAVASVTTWGALTGTVTASTSIVEAYNGVSAEVTGTKHARVISWKDITSQISSSEGPVEVFTAGKLTADVTGGKSVSVEAWGEITGTISAGGSAPASPGDQSAWYNASVTTGGPITKAITASHSVTVHADGQITGTITATHQDAYVESQDRVKDTTIQAGRNIFVHAKAVDNLSATVTTTAPAFPEEGYVDIVASGGVKATVIARGGASIEAGTISEATITVASPDHLRERDVDVSGVDGITKVSITALDGSVRVFSGEAPPAGTSNSGTGTTSAATPLEVSITGGSGDTGAKSAEVTAYGKIKGSVATTGDINVQSWEGISDFAATASSSGSVTLFAAGDVSATAFAGGALSVMSYPGISGGSGTSSGAAGSISGTFDSGSANGLYRDASLVAMGAITAATVTSKGNASLVAGKGISGSNGSIKIDAGGTATLLARDAVSAEVTAQGKIAISVLGKAATGTGSTESPTLAGTATSSGGDVSLFAPGTISATTKANGNASVTTFADLTGSVRASLGNIDITAYGKLSGDIVAGDYTVGEQSPYVFNNPNDEGGNVRIYAHESTAKIIARNALAITSDLAISGSLDAGGSVTLSTGQALSAPVTAGHAITANVAGGSSANLTSETSSISLTAGGTVGAVVTAHTLASVTALDDITASVTGATADVNTTKNLTGTVTAATNLRVSASGNISAPVTAQAGHAVVSTGGTLTADVNAGLKATVNAVGDVTSTITGGTIAEVTAWSDLLGAVQAITGTADVTVWGAADGATVQAGQAILLFVAGDAALSASAGGSASFSGFGTTTLGISAGTTATVSSYGPLTLTGSAQSLDVAGYDTVNATVSATDDLNISAIGGLTGSATSTAGSVTTSSLTSNNMSVNAARDAQVHSLGSVGSINVEAGHQAAIAAWESAGTLNVTAPAGIDLFAYTNLSGTFHATNGPINAIAGGQLSVTSATSNGDVSLASVGQMNLTHVSSAGNVSLASGGSIAGPGSNDFHVTGSKVTVVAGGTLTLNVASLGNSALMDVQILGSIAGRVFSAYDLALDVWGSVEATAAIDAAHDLLALMVAGDLLSDVSAGHAIGVGVPNSPRAGFTVLGNIDAAISSGNPTLYNPAAGGFGDIYSLVARGNIAGSVNAGGYLYHVTAGGVLSAAVSAATTGSLQQHSPEAFGYYATPPALSIGEFIAALADGKHQAQLAADGLLAQKQSVALQLAAAGAASQEALTDMAAQQAELLAEAQALLQMAEAAAQAEVAALKARDNQFLNDNRGQAEAGQAEAATFAATQKAADARSLADHRLQLELAQSRLAAVSSARSLMRLMQAKGKAAELAKEVALSDQARTRRADEWWSEATKSREEMIKLITEFNAEQAKWLINSVLDTFQFYLRAAALVDPTGICSLVSGVVSLLRGNLLEAALDFAGAIPFVGKVVAGTRFASLAAFAAKVGRLACQTKRVFHTARDLVLSADAALKGDYLTAVGYLGMAGLDWFTGGCFAAGTQVITGIDPNDPTRFLTRNIEDIAVGDYVLTRDQDNPDAPLTYRRVTQTFSRQVNNLRVLTVKNPDGSIEQFRTTDEHPFFVSGLGWINADTLKTDDVLITPSGGQATLLATRFEFHPDTLAVYNFEVEGTHSYFVLDGQGLETSPVWVHNAGRKGCTVSANKKNGLEAQAKFANLASASMKLQAAGYRIVGQGARVRTGKGWREIDIVVRKGTRLFGVEVKSGGAVRNSLQVAKDRLINNGRLSFKGSKAEELKVAGQRIVGTIEVHVS